MTLLSSLSQKLSSAPADSITDSVCDCLELILNSFISQPEMLFGSSTTILTSEYFLKIIDLLQNNRRVRVCKEILESFHKFTLKTVSICDAVLIHSLFDITRTVHDSVDCLSAVGEQENISFLINGFIDKIDYGRDLEQQLNFYVECRAIFCNLAPIKNKLVSRVSRLAMNAYKIVKGKHSKKTANFVKACLAYCHITIPSIIDTFRKLQLLLICAEVSLLNRCLPQTDTFLKAAISLIPDVPPSYEEKLAVHVSAMIAFLVVTPGHPGHGPFYIIQGLLNALSLFNWEKEGGALKVKIYINMLSLLCSLGQTKLPYHIDGVDSNDELYGCSKSYLSELSEIISSCIAEVLRQLATIGETDKVMQSR